MAKSAVRKSREKAAKKAILVVEDEPVLVQFYQYVLEEDYDLFMASSGAEAFEVLIKSGDIELMLLDMTLPGLSGMDVLKEMKRSYPAIPVMIVTAGKLNKTTAELAALGACGYLEKPFEVSDLLDKIKSFIESKRQPHT
jgi:DNA-binding response OmpR family regulator